MGALLGGPVADRIGRKWSICAWCMMLHMYVNSFRLTPYFMGLALGVELAQRFHTPETWSQNALEEAF